MDDWGAGDGPEFNSVGCLGHLLHRPTKRHNFMGVRSWGQKAFNHGRQALGNLAESKIQLITLV